MKLVRIGLLPLAQVPLDVKRIRVRMHGQVEIMVVTRECQGSTGRDL